MGTKKHTAVCTHKELFHHTLRHIGMTLPLIAVSLFAGVCGYRYTESMGWIDALFNASMIMSGMGPAAEMHTVAGKLFASFYALYSGLFLIAVTGFLLTPFFQRALHIFHQKD